MPIEQVQLGQRLVGANPLTEDVELDEPDPALARTVVLEATKPDGQLLHAELIRPVEWIAEVGATVDGQIEVTFGEIETTGTARVVAVGPCPELEPGPGALVIGRYRHELVDAPMVELTLDDDSESVRVTANHPYWSVDRQDFTPAGQLRVGETVDTLSGTAHVAAARSYRYTGTVYNLETTEHVYLVGSGGTLVHNNRNCLLKDSNGRWHRNDGTFAKRLGRTPNPRPSVHGNAKASPRKAYLYKAFDQATGKFMKWGITQNKDLYKRYGGKNSSKYDLEGYASGPRDKMLAKERGLVERRPGPDNHERWAGKRNPSHRNYDPNYQSGY